PPGAVRVASRLLAAHDFDPLSDRDLLGRFTSGDEGAFAALLRRHSDMVLGVARRVLRDSQEAEDVAQATFLVLARKARSPLWGRSVANWLHVVAHRLALKACAALRRRPSAPAPNRVAHDLLDEISARELCSVVDEELTRLPDRYRAPVVLC